MDALYSAYVGFATRLSESIDSSQTSIPVEDLAQFPNASMGEPNLATIVNYVEGTLETIEYTGKSSSTGPGDLTGVSRGEEREPGSSGGRGWSAGTVIGRFITAKEVNHIKMLLDPLAEESSNLISLAAVTPGLLDAEIVDHNLDDTEPSLGWFIKYANGTGICFVQSPNADVVSAEDSGMRRALLADSQSLPLDLKPDVTLLQSTGTDRGAWAHGDIDSIGETRFWYYASRDRLDHNVGIIAVWGWVDD